MEDQSLSISVRLRRVRTETAHVSVPITEAVTSPNENGDGRKPDVDKIIEAALRLAKLDLVAWQVEGEPEIRLHPEQTPPNREPIQ
jgi:hypothetical protein